MPVLLLLALLAGKGILAPGARADNLLLGGAEVGRDGNHAYVGSIIRPNPESIWRGRLWMDRTRYEYDSAGRSIRAHATGVEAALGIGGQTGNAWWAAYLGPRYERTELSPDDRGNDNRGSQLNAKLQAEAERGVGSLRLNAGAAYVFGADKYWLRGRLMQPLAPRSLLGVELLRHGGQDYTATQMGGLYALPLGNSSSALFKGGLRHDENRGTGGYAGVEFTIPY